MLYYFYHMQTLERVRSELDTDFYNQLLNRGPQAVHYAPPGAMPYREYVEWQQDGPDDGFKLSYSFENRIPSHRGNYHPDWYSGGPSYCKNLARIATENAMRPILAAYGVSVQTIEHPQPVWEFEEQSILVRHVSPEKFVANSNRIEASPGTFLPPVRFELFNGRRYSAELAIGKFAADRTVLVADNFGSHDVLIHGISWLCLPQDITTRLQHNAQQICAISDPVEQAAKRHSFIRFVDLFVYPGSIKTVFNGNHLYVEDLAAMINEDPRVVQQKIAGHMNAPGDLQLAE